jgi:hypothetical protein
VLSFELLGVSQATVRRTRFPIRVVAFELLDEAENFWQPPALLTTIDSKPNPASLRVFDPQKHLIDLRRLRNSRGASNNAKA